MKSFALILALATFLALSAPSPRPDSRELPAGNQATRPAAMNRENQIDWARIIPGDVGFYVELRDLLGVRRQFAELGIWQVVRDLGEVEADVPAVNRDSARRRTMDYLGMTPEALINLVIGRRVAIIAVNSAQWQNGVVLTELVGAEQLPGLLRRWGARQIPSDGPVLRYTLRSGLLLAVRDRTLIFSPAGDPDGLWSRTSLLLGGQRGPTLAGRSDFAGLRSRLPADYQNLLYVVWPKHDPAAIGGCTRLLMGVMLEPTGIRCEFRGHRDEPASTVSGVDQSWIRMLPENTLAAWVSAQDFPVNWRNWLEAATGDDLSLGGLMWQMMTKGENEKSSTAAWGPGLAFVVSPDRAGSLPGPEIPALALVLEAKDAQSHLAGLDTVAEFIAQLLVLLTAKEGETFPEVSVAKTTCEGVEYHHIAIGVSLVKRFPIPNLAGLRLCWTVLNHRLVISTSPRQMEAMIRTARGKAPALVKTGGVAATTQIAFSPAEPITEWSFIRGSRLSALLNSWLDFARRQYPQTLQRSWWQSWAAERLDRRQRLGLGLAADRQHPRGAVVREIQEDSPAASLLQVGDVIVGAAGKRLTTTQPAREIAVRYRARGAAEVFEVEILRGDQRLKVAIPVPPVEEVNLRGFDPLLALRRLVVLSSRVETITAWRYVTEPNRYDAQLYIRWQPPPKVTTTRSETTAPAAR